MILNLLIIHFQSICRVDAKRGEQSLPHKWNEGTKRPLVRRSSLSSGKQLLKCIQPGETKDSWGKMSCNPIKAILKVFWIKSEILWLKNAVFTCRSL